jgi:hypothetical protein
MKELVGLPNKEEISAACEHFKKSPDVTNVSRDRTATRPHKNVDGTGDISAETKQHLFSSTTSIKNPIFLLHRHCDPHQRVR